MYLVTFEFEMREADGEWRRLNALVQTAAEDSEGYEGRSVWTAPDGERTLVIYRWSSLEGLQSFAEHPDHREAKTRYAEWYDGFEVRVAEVLNGYGDGGLD